MNAQQAPHASPPEKANWLSQRLDEALNHADLRRCQNRRLASCIRIAAIVFSGGATILLGLHTAGHEPVLANGALCFVVLVTVLNAFEPYFNFRALWVEHELAIARFHRIKDDLHYCLSGSNSEGLTSDKLAELYQEYRDIWDTVSKSQIAHRRTWSQPAPEFQVRESTPFDGIGPAK